MSTPLAVRPQNRALALGTAAGVAALAIGGFTLSFTALRDLAQREFAISPQLSFIYPLVIDGFIVIATAAAFTMKKRGPRVTWYPWAALIVFGALSVLGNAAHAIDNPSATFPAWVTAFGASVPAVALLIASHLLVMMIDGKSQARSRQQTKVTGNETTGQRHVRWEPESAKSTDIELAPSVKPASAEEEVPPEIRRPHAVDGPAVPTLADEGQPLVAKLERIVADGGQVTGALIASLEGVSERTGRRRLERLREDHPHFFIAEDDRAGVLR